MKRFYLAFCVAILTAQAQAQTEKKSYSLTLTDPDQPMVLDVELRNGSVRIEGYEGKTVEIQATMRPLSEEQLKEIKKPRQRRSEWQGEKKKVSRSTEGLKPITNRLLSLEIEEQGNEVEISSEQMNYMVELTVQVPSNASVNAQMYRGNGVELVNIGGAIEVETWRGDITASGVYGPIVAETHQSDIVVSFSGFNEKTPSSLTTYSGDIDLTVAQGMNSVINLKSYQGDILSGLDVDFAASDSEVRSRKEGKQEIVIGGQLSGKLNNGGQQLSLNTYSGNLYLRKPAG